MIVRDPIRDFGNRILGYIETDSITKKQTGKDFYNRIVGTYDPITNKTRDFYNVVVASGNILASLIYNENEKQKAQALKNKKK